MAGILFLQTAVAQRQQDTRHFSQLALHYRVLSGDVPQAAVLLSLPVRSNIPKANPGRKPYTQGKFSTCFFLFFQLFFVFLLGQYDLN